MTDKWVVLGRPNCGWCDKVKELLEADGLTYTYMDISNSELKHFLINSGLETVPQVFLNGHLIGGYEDTDDYLLYYDSGDTRL